MTSPLFQFPGAVARGDADSGAGNAHPDAAIAWHYGDPFAEQRAAETGAALFDLSHRDLLTVTGDDRLGWLHTLTSQAFTDLADGTATEALILSVSGHVEHHFRATVLPGAVQLDTEPGRGAALAEYLDSMRFWSKVEVATPALRLLRVTGPERDLGAVLDLPVPAEGAAAIGGDADGGFVRAAGTSVDLAVPADRLADTAARLVAAGARPAGSWAAEALRIPTRTPRIGVDTDERTIPNETGWLQTAVHLNKGCYRGQETVARVDNLGRPPRRIVLLNLDGSTERLPETGSEVLTDAGRVVGRVGTVAQHHEAGPIALALVKRTVPVDAPLLAGGVDAMIDPEDAPDETAMAPRSVIDRRSLPNLRRR